MASNGDFSAHQPWHKEVSGGAEFLVLLLQDANLLQAEGRLRFEVHQEPSGGHKDFKLAELPFADFGIRTSASHGSDFLNALAELEQEEGGESWVEWHDGDETLVRAYLPSCDCEEANRCSARHQHGVGRDEFC